jgi:hypothetical protein
MHHDGYPDLSRSVCESRVVVSGISQNYAPPGNNTGPQPTFRSISGLPLPTFRLLKAHESETALILNFHPLTAAKKSAGCYDPHSAKFTSTKG